MFIKIPKCVIFANLALVLLLQLATVCAQTHPITFTATLSSDQLITPVGTNGSGEVIAVLTGNELVVTGFYRDLSSPMISIGGVPQGIDILEGSAGERGTLIRLEAEQRSSTNVNTINLVGSGLRLVGSDLTEGSFAGSFTLTEAQIEALKQGRYYVQIRTKGHNTGELRGQLSTELVLDASAADLVGIWRPTYDGDTYQNYADGTFTHLDTLSEAGERASPTNSWTFENNLFDVAWGDGDQLEYTLLYKDGTRRYIVVEADGAFAEIVGAWYEKVLIDEEGNRLNLR